MSSEEKHTLAQLLETSNDDEDKVQLKNIEQDSSIDNNDKPLGPDEVCIDCLRMPKELHCNDCDENYCRVCFQFVHRGGKRKDHKFTTLVNIEGIESISKENKEDGKHDEIKEDEEDEEDEDVDVKEEETTNVNDHTTILKKIKKILNSFQ